MQSSNILSHILSYLTYQELLACTCLNKHFQALCNNTFLWRREALRIGIGNLELFGEPLLGTQNSQKSSSCAEWKELLRGLIESKKYWPTDHSVLEPSDTNNLVKEFLSILREPQMPPPTLRRESKCLPTIFQELLTYYLIDESPGALPSFDDFMTEDILAKLFDWSERLENEFKGSIEKNQFTIARWALKDPKFDLWTASPLRLSIESTTDTYDQEDDLCQLNQKFPLKNSSPYLIKLYYAIKKTSSLHCKLTLASILENENDLSLCNDYITK
mmetsp:Transcript_17538/g.17494  ORF Transcript_17538/g.17494 Transcript_17538/m.17494 type:complete len:274 (+) Transcript_17538:75-896(+)